MFTLSAVPSTPFCPAVSPVIVLLVQQSLAGTDPVPVLPVVGRVAVPQVIRA